MFQFEKYVEVIKHPNGGASIVKTDWAKLVENFNETELKQFSSEFAIYGLSEENGVPVFVAAIIEHATDFLDVITFSCLFDFLKKIVRFIYYQCFLSLILGVVEQRYLYPQFDLLMRSRKLGIRSLFELFILANRWSSASFSGSVQMWASTGSLRAVS
ncbi:unnamed protein product [Gongylonema pulchrum]|uniref:HECT domain-containing protein n=1 Tax=Gongylonema pulchrum TaxID=637853 RepID=A0A183DAS2_9BILA|nr:unnamed protein product [Gongylonema pulchrum]